MELLGRKRRRIYFRRRFEDSLSARLFRSNDIFSFLFFFFLDERFKKFLLFDLLRTRAVPCRRTSHTWHIERNHSYSLVNNDSLRIEKYIYIYRCGYFCTMLCMLISNKIQFFFFLNFPVFVSQLQTQESIEKKLFFPQIIWYNIIFVNSFIFISHREKKR